MFKMILYVCKYNVFVFFIDVQSSFVWCNKIVLVMQLVVDKVNNVIFQVVFYVFNQCNDGYDIGVMYVGKFLDSFMMSMFMGNVIMGCIMVVIMFDENFGIVGNQIYMVLVLFGSMSIIVGSFDNINFNYYSLFKIIEQNFGIGNLGQNDVFVVFFNFF